MGPSTFVITMVSVCAGGVGAMVLLASSKERLESIAVIRALAAVAGGGIVGPVALKAMELDDFGTIHLAYLGITLALPLLGAALLVRCLRRPHGRSPMAVGVLLLVPALVGFYATHIEPYRLRVTHASVPIARSR